MVELRRSIRCSGCGTETNFYLSSGLALSELQMHGKCERCGNTLQLNFHLVQQAEASGTRQQEESGQDSGLPEMNLDQALFDQPEEIPSETIKDLIEG